MNIHSHLSSQIREAHREALSLENIANEGLLGIDKNLTVREEGAYYFTEHIWTLKFDGFRDVVVHEAHKMRYSIHPGSDKIILNLKQHYWWLNMKA